MSAAQLALLPLPEPPVMRCCCRLWGLQPLLLLLPQGFEHVLLRGFVQEARCLEPQ
jgi:hypothetical protein